MNKVRLLYIFTFGLLLINFLMVVFLFFSPGKRPDHQGPKKIIKERLQFDAAQVVAYEALITEHRRMIREKDEQILRLKNQLYAGILKPNPTQKDSLEQQLARLHVQIEQINYKHFIDIQKICRPEQLTLFDELVKDLAQLFSKPHPKPKP